MLVAPLVPRRHGRRRRVAVPRPNEVKLSTSQRRRARARRRVGLAGAGSWFRDPPLARVRPEPRGGRVLSADHAPQTPQAPSEDVSAATHPSHVLARPSATARSGPRARLLRVRCSCAGPVRAAFRLSTGRGVLCLRVGEPTVRQLPPLRTRPISTPPSNVHFPDARVSVAVTRGCRINARECARLLSGGRRVADWSRNRARVPVRWRFGALLSIVVPSRSAAVPMLGTYATASRECRSAPSKFSRVLQIARLKGTDGEE
jgi:hypothetical protein